MNKIFNFIGNFFLTMLVAAGIFIIVSGPDYIFRKAGFLGQNETLFGSFGASHRMMICKDHKTNDKECLDIK